MLDTGENLRQLYSFILLDVKLTRNGRRVSCGVVLCPLLHYIVLFRHLRVAKGSALAPLNLPSPEIQKIAVPRSRLT